MDTQHCQPKRKCDTLSDLPAGPLYTEVVLCATLNTVVVPSAIINTVVVMSTTPDIVLFL